MTEQEPKPGNTEAPKGARFWRGLFRNGLVPAMLWGGIVAARMARGLGMDILAVVEWAVACVFMGWIAGLAAATIED